MTVLIAVPVFRVGCKVGIDRVGPEHHRRGRALATTRQSKSIAALAAEADLPRQIVVASIARLMRFRLVEVTPSENGVAFRKRLRLQGRQQRQPASVLPKAGIPSRQFRH